MLSSENKLENLEDLYPLSPMQQGMLFHTIYAPESGVYFEQSVFTIKGELDVKSFERAWQQVLNRHSILRSSFLWEDLDNPQQVVHRRVNLPFEKQDWSNLSPAQQEERLNEYLAADRARGFDLGSAPLIRLALFQNAPDLHRFVFSRHHLLLDRWSRSLILKEVFAFYDAVCQGEQLTLEALRPYGDYIAWLDAQDKGAAERYWRELLAGVLAPTTLAAGEKLSPRVASGDQYGDERIQLSEESTARLRAFAREQKLTLNILAQASWAVLLSRYTRDDDVVFGVTVAGRPATLAGVESMVGLFINTLPLRARVPSLVNVLPWLKELQEQQSAMQQYEYSSLMDIQGWSDVPRGVPLFESIFVFENLPVSGSFQASKGGLEFQSDRGLGSNTGYPLTVLVSPGSKLTIQLVYDRERFDQAMIRRMLGHLQMLLENLPRNFERPIASWPMLTEAEREQILADWNDTEVDFNEESVLPLFEAQVALTPDAAAVVFENQQLSYRELNARANQLARYLRGLGAGPDARVGIAIDRSLEMAVAVLGTLKAGAAYVPLDPAYPGERLSFMLKDAQCAALLTNERLVAGLPDAGVNVLCLDRDWGKVARETSENPETRVSGENLAYVIYTSGSTGWPKGVAMTHRALGNLISWQIAKAFAPARTLQFASLSFDVSFQEIFSTWCSGGVLLLVSDELRRDAAELLHFMAANQVQRIFVPFVYLQHLAEACTDTSDSLLPVHLREIITAGEQLEITPQISQLCKRLKDCTLHNHYGPSETHVVTAHRLSSVVDHWPRLPPIGRPIANTQIYVLDQNGEPAPIRVPGELCIGGANVSRGYLNRPELTAEKFIPDPFSREPGARIYCTGDLARYGSDGAIDFLGRIDSQVKIRGFRVELGEIETTLATHPQVREAVVVVRDDADDRSLVAYIVTGPERPEGPARDLRGFLKTKLPDYMVPANFVFLEALPLTPSGKINRRALPAVDPNEGEAVQQYEAPRTLAEEKLAEIWAAVLRRERVGIWDNFFESGGHSLLATQLISRVRSAFKVELPLRNLFEFPVVADLAASIVEFQKRAEANAPQVITRHIDRDAQDLPAKIDQLSDAQVEALLNEALAENTRN
jgi:amino acid adenylation domain-containing protein